MPRAVLGDFLAAARGHMEAALLPAAGTPLPVVIRDLRRLVETAARYADDLAPAGAVEAEGRDDLSDHERAIIDTGEALHLAAGYLERAETAASLTGELAGQLPPGSMASAAASLTAGRDLLFTHVATGPDGLAVEQTEWAAVVTSAAVTRALTAELALWTDHIASFTGHLAAGSPPAARDAAGRPRVAPGDFLTGAERWLRAAAASSRQAAGASPAQAADRELLGAIPSAAPPPRLPPGARRETVTELCEGVTGSAVRFRAEVRGRTSRARWSPGVSSGGWQWTARTAKVASHLTEVILLSLAAASPRLSSSLRNAAEAMTGMRAGWDMVDRVWRAVVTDTRVSPTAAMIEGGDLIIRLGRVAWDNPQWTPARPHAVSRVNPDLAAADAATVAAIVSAAHHAVDALAFAAGADMDAAETAARAGRLYVPTRSLPGGYDVPRAFAPAPPGRSGMLREAYSVAGRASREAVRALDVLAAEAGSTSRVLALARAAVPAQSRRRGHAAPRGPGNHLPAAAVPGRLEETLTTLRVSDEGLLLRAAMIDRAARRLHDEVLRMTAPPPTPATGTLDAADRVTGLNFSSSGSPRAHPSASHAPGRTRTPPDSHRPGRRRGTP